jgi:hypothetical protein
MNKNELYHIGKKLGMNKKDINIVLANIAKENIILNISKPMDSYKGMPGRYGTFSIKDIH